MHQIFNEKKSIFQISQRRFDEVETSPNRASKAIFVQNLMLNTIHTSIWPQTYGKGLNFDDYDKRYNSRLWTYIYVHGTQRVKQKILKTGRPDIRA